MKFYQNILLLVFILSAILLFLCVSNNILNLVEAENGVSYLFNINNFFFYGLTALISCIIYIVIKFKR